MAMKAASSSKAVPLNSGGSSGNTSSVTAKTVSSAPTGATQTYTNGTVSYYTDASGNNYRVLDNGGSTPYAPGTAGNSSGGGSGGGYSGGWSGGGSSAPSAPAAKPTDKMVDDTGGGSGNSGTSSSGTTGDGSGNSGTSSGGTTGDGSGNSGTSSGGTTVDGSGNSGASGGGTTGDGSGNSGLSPNSLVAKTINAEMARQANQQLSAGIDGDVSIDRINHVDTVEEEAILNQLVNAQIEQGNRQIDNTVNNGIRDLNRTMEDAQEQFQTQRNQIAANEQRALDNQVLYSEARGDRGGIGQSQYNAIQNTAAINELTVQKEQTKLATDTSRQIADLRAQGEFQKADQLLSITQTKLQQLMQLKQWAKENNISIDEFNSQLAEWEANYKLSLVDAQLNVANATGVFSNGAPTYTAWANAQEQIAAAGNALIQAGLMPTASQLAAMGWTPDEASAFLQQNYSNGAWTKQANAS